MGVAMSVPFQITPQGGVAETADERRQLLDRVQALVATLPGTRAMRSQYGVATSRALFIPDELAGPMLRTMISEAVSRWEPSAVVSAFTTTVNDSLGLVNVAVQVSRADAPAAEIANSRTVRISAAGTVSGSPA